VNKSRRAILNASLVGAFATGMHAARVNAEGFDPAPTKDGKIGTLGAIDVTDYGVIGDGLADDSAAIARACLFAIAQFRRGIRCYLQFPSGRFLLKGTKIPMFVEAPVGIRGRGEQQTTFIIDPEYQGDVFSWSNCWQESSYQKTRLGKSFSAGAFIENVGFLGNLERTGTVNALGFYDINDNVEVSNVEFDYILGRAIYVGGVTGGNGFGIMRESRFNELRIFHSGTPDHPCIEIGSSGASDGTNELIFSQIDIFAPGGHGMVIRNGGTQPVRLIKIFGLRIEKFLSGFNGLQIGDERFNGKIYGVNAIGLELLTGQAGSTAIAIVGSYDHQVETCFFQGQIINCYGNGIHVNTGCGNRVELMRNAAREIGVLVEKTRFPVYYFCPIKTTVSVAPGCSLLVPSYVQYHELSSN